MSRLDLSTALSPAVNTYSPDRLQSPVSPPLSYISARRPSLTPHPDVFTGSFRSTENQSSQPVQYSGLRNETSFEAEEEDEDANFRQSLQIDMKTLLGDAVGNMSISPTSRDVVLAARKGLFIIDLHSPLEVPRFLPQGGTWDVADVQWNPHPSHAEYVVSTSSERLLIWNLLLAGKTSIEYILQSHYRAITDINWHCFEPDLVCSIGVDSWVWAWDIREPQKPAFGLCAFNSAGTQVKWNRKDSNILASSHFDEVLIWDRRRGSIPLSRVKAHDGKIYGIDWSHSLPNEIISCSLDKKIKVWDINDLSNPKQTFITDNPVWRARDLPFGRGIMSLPQRGGTSLEMWSYDNPEDPIESFDGHADVVKEFVWRSRGGYTIEGAETDYQLITWSKDKTLRFWPLSRDTMLRAGVAVDSATKRKTKGRQREDTISFRSPPLGSDLQPALSAPRGHRTILAGVRAPLPEASSSTHPVLLPHHGSTARASRLEVLANNEGKKDKRSSSKPRSSILNISNVSPIAPAAASERPDGTMSKGNAKGSKALANMEPSTWLQSIRTESVGPLHARISSGSRPPSGPDRDGSDSLKRRRRSVSRSREEDVPRDPESSTFLLDEINSVVNKLTPLKVKLERHDLSKHRSCTFGLHGPWGESASVNVFVRVTFTFPREYPQAVHPLGTPLVDVERSPLIPIKRRAYMRRELRKIRETERPCLELCLRFLLFGDGGESRPGLDSGSSSDEDRPAKSKRTKDFSASLIRDHQNLAEPRSSQGVFGPNGQLVCVFRSLPRLVKAVQQESISVSPSIPTRGRETIPRLFQSPLQLSDAVRRLAIAANDRSFGFPGLKDPEDTENILRIMNNLLSFTQPRHHSSTDHHRGGRSAENVQSNNYSLLPKRMTIVYVKDKADVVGAHRAISEEYVVMDSSPSELAARNAEIARKHYRSDHERIFRCLSALLRTSRKEASNSSVKNTMTGVTLGHIARNILLTLHEGLMKAKDIQILAMFAVIVLQAQPETASKGDSTPLQPRSRVASGTTPSRSAELDYFTVRGRRGQMRISPSISPRLTRLPSTPTTPSPLGQTQAQSSSLSSRGSWSSLFTASSMRQLMSSSTSQDGSSEPRISSKLVLSKSSSGVTRMSTATNGLRRQYSALSHQPTIRPDITTKPITPTSESSPVKVHLELTRPAQSRIAWPSSGTPTGNSRHRPATFSQVVVSAPSDSTISEKSLYISEDLRQPIKGHIDEDFPTEFIDKLVAHVVAYAEMLYAWGLVQQRAQLLKVLRLTAPSISASADKQMLSTLEVTRCCQVCSRELATSTLPLRGVICPNCVRVSAMLCAVCRMPVKGLSHNCVSCFHVTHLRCWDRQRLSSCPTGCGCECKLGI